MNGQADDSEYDIVTNTPLYSLKRKGLHDEFVEVNRSPFLIGIFIPGGFLSKVYDIFLEESRTRPGQ